MIRSIFSHGADPSISQCGFSLSAPMQYSFSLENEKSIRLDGLLVNLNESGDIWGARYDTGEAVRHNDRYSMAKGLNGTLWLGYRNGLWHPVD
ncbi:MAG TPA: hypothetical protein PK671_21670 [Candidatus Obscuribacter sp.]|nr:hypothetical protein [Candidatus Obscuribacter sp.]HNB24377.1 hypothetical protein [Candidatus Melainabacteria bacterium]